MPASSSNRLDYPSTSSSMPATTGFVIQSPELDLNALLDIPEDLNNPEQVDINAGMSTDAAMNTLWNPQASEPSIHPRAPSCEQNSLGGPQYSSGEMLQPHNSIPPLTPENFAPGVPGVRRSNPLRASAIFAPETAMPPVTQPPLTFSNTTENFFKGTSALSTNFRDSPYQMPPVPTANRFAPAMNYVEMPPSYPAPSMTGEMNPYANHVMDLENTANGVSQAPSMGVGNGYTSAENNPGIPLMYPAPAVGGGLNAVGNTHTHSENAANSGIIDMHLALLMNEFIPPEIHKPQTPGYDANAYLGAYAPSENMPYVGNQTSPNPRGNPLPLNNFPQIGSTTNEFQAPGCRLLAMAPKWREAFQARGGSSAVARSRRTSKKRKVQGEEKPDRKGASQNQLAAAEAMQGSKREKKDQEV